MTRYTRFAFPCALLLAALLLAFLTPASPDGPPYPASVNVRFSPNGGCMAAVLQHVNAAQDTIRVQAYGFTHADLGAALVNTLRRGVQVHCQLDRSNEGRPNSLAELLIANGAHVMTDPVHAIAHNKVILIDATTVLTGSYNFSANAETRNSENLLILTDCPGVCIAYDTNWTQHAEHCRPYVPRHSIFKLPPPN